MLKKTKLTYRGMNQDITKSKRSPEFYFDAENIRIQATDSATTGSVTNDKGTVLACSLAVGQEIIGHAVLKNYLVVFSTNGITDKITRITLPEYTVKELFSGSLNFSKDHLIETEVNYESESIQKVYWADGVNQLRHINIISEGYSQSDATLFDAVPEVSFSAPYVYSVDYGGIHTAGMIQYAYNLVKQNGSQSAISPASELYPLNKSKSGGKVNESVGKILNVKIDMLDPKYDIIRLYAIKYTSYNEQPSIHLIAEDSIKGNPSFLHSDDGRVIRTISADQFLFLGGTPIIPSTITSKFNRLILGNIKEEYFDIDTSVYDTRAYSFPLNSIETKIKNNGDVSYATITLSDDQIKFTSSGQLIPFDHDCIRPADTTSITEYDTVGPSIFEGTSEPIDLPDEEYYQYIDSQRMPTSALKLHAEVSVEIVGITTINKTCVLSPTQSLNTVQAIAEFISGPEFVSPGYTISAYVGTYTNEQGEAITPQSLISYVTDTNTQSTVLHQIYVTLSRNVISTTTTVENPCIYKYNSALYGATGTNVSVEVVQKPLVDPRMLLKSNETYRIGIEFYNKRGQHTEPKWITDLKIPSGNLNSDYNTLKVTLDNVAYLANQGVVGWRILRVERTDADKTVLCQGIVSPMIFQRYEDSDNGSNLNNGVTYADESLLKIPSPFMRNITPLEENWTIYNDKPYIYGATHGQCISLASNGNEIDDPRQEVFRDDTDGTRRHMTFQETRLMQMFSPEVIFGDMSLSENLQLRFSHTAVNPIVNCSEWAKQYNTDNGLLQAEMKRNETLSLFNQVKGRFNAFNQYARIGGTGDHNIQNKYQYYRNYSFGKYVIGASYNIQDEPLICGAGQSSMKYASLSKYGFSNQLGTIMTDTNHQDGGDDGIISVNSIANRNITLALENDQTLESVLLERQTEQNGTGVFEIVRNITNQYGGNTFEARSRNSYLRIGKYKSLNTEDNIMNIDQAGDVFVGQFRFARILPNTSSIQSSKYYEMTEIVEFPVESSIDINNRSDESTSWDSVFLPTFDQYHNYNKVYSQQPVFNRTTATPFTFQLKKVFDNRINATKVKTAGEIVDSWTDVLVNEELYVDGKYGPITKIIQNNDLVYCLQEQAISGLEISPRVQTISTDGTAIELGRGDVLYNYKYISTNSGCVNPQSVFKSQNSIYYIDLINKSLNRVIGADLIGLTDKHGLHTMMFKELNYHTQKYSKRVTGCFDMVTNDAYFTTPTFTLSFNEQLDAFTSRYSFKPLRYIYCQYGMYSSDLGQKLWKHGSGERCNYYNQVYPSLITLIVAPEPDIDCVFNNGEFKSEVYDIYGNAVHSKTITSVECWNEHQSSPKTPLTVGANIRRKFWDWNFFIPRDMWSPLQRMRGQWLYMNLEFDNTLNEKLILHDMIISYDAVYKQ